MFSFIAGILVGSISAIFILGLTSSRYYTEDDIRSMNASIENWKQTANIFETALTQRNDEVLSATRMAQYWRARCMNEHLGMKVACDGDGNCPTNEDDITHAEQNTIDILNAAKMIEADNAEEIGIHKEAVSA